MVVAFQSGAKLAFACIVALGCGAPVEFGVRLGSWNNDNLHDQTSRDRAVAEFGKHSTGELFPLTVYGPAVLQSGSVCFNVLNNDRCESLCP